MSDAKLNLSSGSEKTIDDTKFDKIEKSLKIPYLYFIQTKWLSKGTFEMHFIIKISVRY